MKSVLAPPNSPSSAGSTPEWPAFSLVLGGPFFRFCRRAHLAGDALELVHRQALTSSNASAWLPLLVLSLLEGTLFLAA